MISQLDDQTNLWAISLKNIYQILLCFWSTCALEPYLSAVITVASSSLFFQTFFQLQKNYMGPDYSAYNVFTAPTIFTNNAT